MSNGAIDSARLAEVAGGGASLSTAVKIAIVAAGVAGYGTYKYCDSTLGQIHRMSPGLSAKICGPLEKASWPYEK